MRKRDDSLGSLAPSRGPSWSQVGAKLSLKSTPKLLAFSNPISKPLGFDVGSILGRFSGSKIDPGTGSKLKKPMCTKSFYLQYETMIFTRSRGPNIDEKPMSKRLLDKIRFQYAKRYEKVSNIGPSWDLKITKMVSKTMLEQRTKNSVEKGHAGNRSTLRVSPLGSPKGISGTE